MSADRFDYLTAYRQMIQEADAAPPGAMGSAGYMAQFHANPKLAVFNTGSGAVLQFDDEEKRKEFMDESSCRWTGAENYVDPGEVVERTAPGTVQVWVHAVIDKNLKESLGLFYSRGEAEKFITGITGVRFVDVADGINPNADATSFEKTPILKPKIAKATIHQDVYSKLKDELEFELVE